MSAFRNSKQRSAVEKLLSKKNYHPTVDELYALMRKEFPRISLATVYRNVEQLCQMGKIIRLTGLTGPARYDGNVEPHYHIECRSCGDVEDVWIDFDLRKHIDFENLLEQFTIERYKIDFYGICDTCITKV